MVSTNPSIDHAQVDALITLALQEDIGRGDVTSQAIFSSETQASFQFRNREPLVMAGGFLIPMILQHFEGEASVEQHVAEGDYIEDSTPLITMHGPVLTLLTAERVMLNMLQRCCAVATHTKRYVDAAANEDVRILDTRKTMPGFRSLDKYAVTCGGGHNHRMRLDDRYLIKDNHIAAAGSLSAAVAAVKKHVQAGLLIEVECDTLDQVQEAVANDIDWILLDNMPPETIAQALALRKGAVKFEASGGVNLQSIHAIASTGVDAISVGALTHSAPMVDIGLDAL